MSTYLAKKAKLNATGSLLTQQASRLAELLLRLPYF